MRAGLVSVSFRNLDVARVIQSACAAGLEGIEWGGDVHVPPWNRNAAREVGLRTRDAGLEVSAYGSYLRFNSADGEPEVRAILETASALGTRMVRVWAGTVSPEQCDSAERQRLVGAILEAAKMADDLGLKMGFECHQGTLTACPASTHQLLQEVNAANLSSFWQPTPGLAISKELAGLKLLGPWISHCHVFHWSKDDRVIRLPLRNGEAVWKIFLNLLKGQPPLSGSDRWLSLEFIKDDSLEQLSRDSLDLRTWLEELIGSDPV